MADTGGTRPLIAITSRCPVVRTKHGWRTAQGGLAPVVRRVLEERGGACVSWNGGEASVPEDQTELGFGAHTFSLARRDGAGFSSGYSNRTLWPLFHDAIVPPVFEPSWWPNYHNANVAFARAAVGAASGLDVDPHYWVHDYHLALVPGCLRDLGVRSPISFFLHTPFPSPPVFARLPQREAVLEGMARANVVGLQTEADRQRFLAAWTALDAGDPPATITAPASVDAAALVDLARDPAVRSAARGLRKNLGDRVLLLGVERLDYTKGILERLRALELVFEHHPDLRRRVVYVQIATPSRERLPEYRHLRASVEREVGRLNGRFTDPGQPVPIRYFNRPVSERELIAYFLAADVALVTPLRDGMNLVGKEFVVAQAAVDGAGVLVLSQFAGAADELTDALLCNPFDIVELSETILESVFMDESSRRKRVAALARSASAFTVEDWAAAQLGSGQMLRPKQTA